MTKFLAIFSLVIIVLLAFAACGEESTPTPAPAAQAIEAEVQRSVAAALADQSADSIREDAMSTEDMSALVQEAIGAQAPYTIPISQSTPKTEVLMGGGLGCRWEWWNWSWRLIP